MLLRISAHADGFFPAILEVQAHTLRA